MTQSHFKPVKAGSFFDQFIQFEYSLEHGRIGISAIPQHHMTRIECPDCGEVCFRIMYHGEAKLIVAGAKVWSIHQCPEPCPECGNPHPDEAQRDGDGEPV